VCSLASLRSQNIRANANGALIHISNADRKGITGKPIDIKRSEGFIPPLGFVRQILSALNWIDPEDLEGIDFILLFDDGSTYNAG
jgi:hypothetical protein